MRLWFAGFVLAVSIATLFALLMVRGGLMHAILGVGAVVGVTLLMNVLFIAFE